VIAKTDIGMPPFTKGRRKVAAHSFGSKLQPSNSGEDSKETEIQDKKCLS